MNEFLWLCTRPDAERPRDVDLSCDASIRPSALFHISQQLSSRSTQFHLHTHPSSRGMGIPDSPTKRARIVALKSAKVKNCDIKAEVGGSISQINRIYAKWKGKKQFYGKTPGRGRKAILTDRDVRRIIRTLHTGQAGSLREVHARWYPHVHENTLRTALHKAGFNGFRRRKVPLITQKKPGEATSFRKCAH